APVRGAAGRADWRSIFRAWHINHVVLHDASLNRSTRLFRSMMANEREFVPLLLDGRTADFGWVDPEQPQTAATFTPLALKLKRRAFQPSTAERAPLQWPGRDPEPRTWLDAFVLPTSSRAPETDEATFYVNHFDDLKPRYFSEHLKTWTNAQTA